MRPANIPSATTGFGLLTTLLVIGLGIADILLASTGSSMNVEVRQWILHGASWGVFATGLSYLLAKISTVERKIDRVISQQTPRAEVKDLVTTIADSVCRQVAATLTEEVQDTLDRRHLAEAVRTAVTPTLNALTEYAAVQHQITNVTRIPRAGMEE